jgi:serine/threonine-protein kinase RsbW
VNPAMEPGKTHTLEPGALRAETTSVSSRTFPADRTAPRAAAAWLRSLPTGLSATRLGDAELCLDELVTNVVRYAWTDATSATSHAIHVAVDRTPSELEIVVQDDGRPFDPTAAILPPLPHSLEEAAPGGRGLLLVRSIAPRLSYERRDDANRVTLGFPIEATEQA